MNKRCGESKAHQPHWNGVEWCDGKARSVASLSAVIAVERAAEDARAEDLSDG